MCDEIEEGETGWTCSNGDDIGVQNLIRNIRREITSDTKTSDKDNIEMDLMEVRYDIGPLAGF
jgi:hypothetical protein